MVKAEKATSRDKGIRRRPGRQMLELICVNLLSAPACACIPHVSASIHLVRLAALVSRLLRRARRNANSP